MVASSAISYFNIISWIRKGVIYRQDGVAIAAIARVCVSVGSIPLHSGVMLSLALLYVSKYPTAS